MKCNEERKWCNENSSMKMKEMVMKMNKWININNGDDSEMKKIMIMKWNERKLMIIMKK